MGYYIAITVLQLLFVFWWGFWTSGLALSLKEQYMYMYMYVYVYVCIVVWPLLQTGNKGPAQNLHPESVHYILRSWPRFGPSHFSQVMQLYFCNPNSSDRRVFWELVKAYSVFGCIAATSYYASGRHSRCSTQKKLVFSLILCLVLHASFQRPISVYASHTLESDVNKSFPSFGDIFFGHVMHYIIH